MKACKLKVCLEESERFAYGSLHASLRRQPTCDQHMMSMLTGTAIVIASQCSLELLSSQCPASFRNETLERHPYCFTASGTCRISGASYLDSLLVLPSPVKASLNVLKASGG